MANGHRLLMTRNMCWLRVRCIWHTGRRVCARLVSGRAAGGRPAAGEMAAGGRVTLALGQGGSSLAQGRNSEATCYVGNLDEQAKEEPIWELFMQAGPVGTCALRWQLPRLGARPRVRSSLPTKAGGRLALPKMFFSLPPPLRADRRSPSHSQRMCTSPRTA